MGAVQACASCSRGRARSACRPRVRDTWAFTTSQESTFHSCSHLRDVRCAFLYNVTIHMESSVLESLEHEDETFYKEQGWGVLLIFSSYEDSTVKRW